MSLTTLPHRRSGLIALGLATGLAISSLVSAGSATAVKPVGSRAEVILETGDTTADPDNAITSGWWGHEGGAGPAGTGTTFLSMNGANAAGQVNDESLTALRAAMGTDDLSNIYYAIVPFSADGTNEAPSVAVGENAAEAFDWVLGANFGSALSGNNLSNDSVIPVSTLAQITAWVAAGQPIQGFDNSLVLHDVTAPGSPVSVAPQGTSILNTWQAGQQLSLVAYVADGFDLGLNNLPIVKRDANGKAQTAWLPFTTLASPSSPLRTSAGYQVAGAVKPTVSVTDAFTGSSGTVTAVVKKLDGTTATDASGNIEFAEVVNGTTGTFAPVPTSGGTASLPVTLAPGGVRTYDVRYVPDDAAQPIYLTSNTVRYTAINEVAANPTATTTALTASGSGDLTATVSPGAAGSVSFSDGSTSLGQVAVSGGSAKLSAKLAAGQHALKAVFTPSDATAFQGSTGTTTVWVPKFSTALKPKKAVAGKKAKLTVTLDTPGTAAAGQLRVTIKPPKGGKAKTVTVAVSGGKATIKLPKLAKGKTKLTIEYAGSGSVLAASAQVTVKAK